MVHVRRRWQAAVWVGVAALAFGGLGCAFGEFRPDDPMNRKFSLEKMQKRYSYYVRWSKFKQASQFMDPRQRKDFIEWAPDVDDVRFTDYQIGDVDVDEEKRNSTVDVTYSAYSLRSLVVYDLVETQTWSRAGRGNNWMVKTSFVAMPVDEPAPEVDGEVADDAQGPDATAMN